MRKGLISTLRWVKPGTPKGDTFRAAPPAAPPTDPLSRTIDAIGLPEVPPEHAKTAVDEAIYLLKVAAEVEHGLLVQYLYAAYSLDTEVAPLGWKTTLVNIAVQEMCHLLNVQNMLLALKPSEGKPSRPYFDRANFPVPADQQRFYPFPFFFEPLSETSLAKYVIAESPTEVLGPVDLSKLSDDERAVLKRALATATEVTKGTINHVGVLYAKLYWMFQDDNTPTKPWSLPPERFPGVRHIPPAAFVSGEAAIARQGTPDEFDVEAGAGSHITFREIWPIASAKDARAAINQIAEQGEGTKIADDSHFWEFLDLYKDFTAFTPPTGHLATLGVPTNPNTGNDPATADGRIDQPGAAVWARLFNLRYQMLLAELFLILSESDGENAGNGGLAQRDQLISRALHREMKSPSGIQGLAAKLVQMPRHPLAVGAPRPGPNRAAPPFELPGDPLPTEPAAQRDLLLKLIDQSASEIDAILNLTGEDAPSAGDQTRLKNLKTNDAAFRAAVAAMTFTDPPT